MCDSSRSKVTQVHLPVSNSMPCFHASVIVGWRWRHDADVATEFESSNGRFGLINRNAEPCRCKYLWLQQQEYAAFQGILPEACHDVDPWRELHDSAPRIRRTWKRIFSPAKTHTETRFKLRTCQSGA